MATWEVLGNRLSDVITYEEDERQRFSRENINVAASQTLVVGSLVVSTTGIGGTFVEFDGSQTLTSADVGIVVQPLTTDSTGGAQTVMICRHARYLPANLTWKSGVTTLQKTAFTNALLTKGVVPSSGV
jgi:hypothetical protein